jgi:hypothetical protein
MTTVTTHGKNRMKERCGIPKRAAERNAQRAYDKGTTYDNTHGKLREYIDRRSDTTSITDIRVWDGNIYVFYGETLLTVYPIPRSILGKEHKNAIKAKEGRKNYGKHYGNQIEYSIV